MKILFALLFAGSAFGQIDWVNQVKNKASTFNFTPAWDTIVGVSPGFRSSVNNFPLVREFQGLVTPTAVGLDAAVNGGTSFPGAILGMAGYAQTNFASPSGGTAAVGVYGAGYIGANATGSNATQSWGANFLATNCNAQACTTGFGNNNSYGIEVDMNMYPSVGAPVDNATGIWITGGSLIQPAGLVDAVHIGVLGQFEVPQIAWKNAIEVDPGAAAIGLKVGPLDSTASPSGCMPIVLTSRSSSGTLQNQKINCDPLGNIILTPGSGAGQVVLEDINGNTGAAVVPNGSTPFFSVTNQLRIGTTILAPALASTTGQRYVCVDAAGLLHSSVTACSGT